ncbi:hypothetical protein LTR15_003835 [Elasticomyces elasticus]|nr:hypothetical protein LTR15_003835 [Elasticomyces elasticus]
MTATRTETKPWDFSHVLELVHSLSSKDVTISDDKHSTAWESVPDKGEQLQHVEGIDTHDFGTPAAKLGDFARIWQYLGTPLDSPTPTVPPLTSEPLSTADFTAKLDYTSDGATYYKPTKGGKAVSWQDEAYDEEPATDVVTDRSASPDTPEEPQTPTLTKAQRKKQNRKARRAQEASDALKNATVSESEADHTHRKTPARKASAHVKNDATPVAQATPAAAINNVTEPLTLEATLRLATARVAQKTAELKAGSTPKPSNSKAASSQPIKMPSTKRQVSLTAVFPRTAPVNHTLINHTAKQWPVTPSKAPATQLLPASVKPISQQATLSNVAQPAPTAAQSSPTANQNLLPSQKKSKFVIEPKIVRSGEDRHWALLIKLIGDFWEDRKHIISPMNLTTHNNDPTGIHVFVDASNIFIGFNEQLKRSRNIPQYVQVPAVDLSFDALALLMERRRPVAKRVLAGSTPHLPAFDKAKAVGYECSILEKVYKARELTERQIYFRDNPRYGGRPFTRASAKASAASNSAAVAENAVQSSTNNATGHQRQGSGSGSGSETGPTPQYAPARMIEQGVDEILHLKMLESIVDSEAPSTIVLATGDAAQAEYSPGFMAMVERALKKGWKIELVSWSSNINGLYRKPEWLAKWGEMFKVIYLDDYAEELLEM